MAALAQLAQAILTAFGSDHYSFTQVTYGASGDTVVLPAIPESAAALPAQGNTAPTVTVSATSSAVTLTGGTTGATVIIVAKHAGNPAGVNAAGVGE